MEFDEIYQYIGNVGAYNIIMYFSLGIFELVAVESIGMNFQGGRMKHWCMIPRLQNYSHAQQKYLGIPFDGDGEYSSCSRFPIDFNDYTEQELLSWNRSVMTQNFTSGDMIPCDDWEYDRTDYASTVVDQWNLVCGRSWMSEMISTSYMGGRLIGAVVSGMISDRIGRKKMLAIFHSIKVLGGALCFIDHYAGFNVGRFLMALGTMASQTGAYIVLLEGIGEGNFRAVFAILWGCLWSIGYMLQAGIAYFIRDYFKMQAVQTIPLVIPFFLFIFIDESPRWLYSQGRFEEAEKIVRKMAAINRKELPADFRLTKKGKEEKPQRGSLPDMFAGPNLSKKTALIWLEWFSCSLVYYGLALNTGSLVGSVFLNTFLNGLLELPARLLGMVMLNKIGRRSTVAGTMIFSGFCSFLGIAFMFTDNLKVGLNVVSMLGKTSVTIAFTSSYLFTGEQYPTYIRNISIGSSSMMARVSGMIAPYMGAPMERVWKPLPSVIFGVFTSVSGGLLYLLPDTLNRKPPETIEEAEAFVREKKRGKAKVSPIELKTTAPHLEIDNVISATQK